MPDYYVNPTTGNDGNPGTSSSPVRTITRATELAAIVDRATGTIFIDPGTYSSREDFPILVPPAFGLQGRGSTPNDCRIEFTGGVSDSVAVQGGASVRNLTVVAAPPAGAPRSCNFSIGLLITVDGCELENIGNKLHESEPEDGVGFGIGIWIKGADARASHLEIERSTLYVSDSDSVITECRATSGSITVGGEGAMRVENCSLTNSRLAVYTSTSAVVEGNWLNGEGISVLGNGLASAVGPIIRSNIVRNGLYDALVCRLPGTALVERNTISAKRRTVSILEGGSPFLRNNDFKLLNPDGDTRFTEEHVLWVAPGRTIGPGPCFEGNLFTIGPGLYPLRPMWVNGPADFGGGIGRSIDMNFFRLPPGLFIDFDHPGQAYARDNFWNYLPPQYRDGPDTTVDTEGARLDPARVR